MNVHIDSTFAGTIYFFSIFFQFFIERLHLFFLKAEASKKRLSRSRSRSLSRSLSLTRSLFFVVLERLQGKEYPSDKKKRGKGKKTISTSSSLPRSLTSSLALSRVRFFSLFPLSPALSLAAAAAAAHRFNPS